MLCRVENHYHLFTKCHDDLFFFSLLILFLAPRTYNSEFETLLALYAVGKHLSFFNPQSPIQVVKSFYLQTTELCAAHLRFNFFFNTYLSGKGIKLTVLSCKLDSYQKIVCSIPL